MRRVVDKAGQTCRSCLTLNPVGAPACVRCNSPLPDAQQAAPPPSPWSSPPNSAPVQQLLPAPQNPAAGPPAFPQQQLAPAPPPVGSPPVGPPPVQQPYPQQPHPSQQQPYPSLASGQQPAAFPTGPPPNRRRRTLIISNVIVLAGLIIGAVVLWVTRPHYLDTGAVERTVGDRIGASVDCPGKVHREQGTRFTCRATYDSGAKAKVSITVRNDDGDYRWSVSSRTGGG